jgi:glycosyltransferase involved in cell wall biosynthesis
MSGFEAVSASPGRPTAAEHVRVLLVAPYGPGGGGIGRMMEYLVAAHPEGWRLEPVESRGGGRAAWSVWFVLLAAWRIIAAAAGGAPCIVHLNVAERGSVARKGALLLLARAVGLPAVLHLHGAELIDMYARLPWPARRLLGVPFRAATVCIVLGGVWRDFLRDELGVASARIRVLPNGVPRPVLRRFPLPSPSFGFVFLGNLHKRKGLHDLLHALAAPALRELEWSLSVAGGGDTGALHRCALALGIGARVRFLGWLERDEATLLLSQAGALVLPSYAEGLPLVLLEAASLGVPVLTTRVGAVGDFFTAGETAALVAPGDRAALSAALLRLIAEPAYAAGLGRAGRTLYRSGLTLERFVDGLLAIYREHCASESDGTAPRGMQRLGTARQALIR